MIPLFRPAQIQISPRNHNLRNISCRPDPFSVMPHFQSNHFTSRCNHIHLLASGEVLSLSSSSAGRFNAGGSGAAGEVSTSILRLEGSRICPRCNPSGQAIIRTLEQLNVHSAHQRRCEGSNGKADPSTHSSLPEIFL